MTYPKPGEGTLISWKDSVETIVANLKAFGVDANHERNDQ